MQILSHIRAGDLKAILPGVRWHHERWDGSGYPDGLASGNIPWLSRLLAVADVFDALSSDRSYRGANHIDRAVTMIVNNAGRHFDPVIARALGALHARGELTHREELEFSIPPVKPVIDDE